MTADRERRLEQLLLDETPCFVALVDDQLRLVWTNGVFRRLFGQRDGEPCYVVYKQRSDPCPECPVVSSFADRGTHCSDEQGLTADNQLITYQVRAFSLPEAPGQARLVAQIGWDTTQLHELESALSQAERLATVGMTAAGLAHTIKNILAGLEGGAYAVDTGFERHDEQRLRAGWQMVQEYLTQLRSLVGNLLSYAKPRETQRGSTDVAQLVEDVARLYRDKAALAGIDLQCHVAEGLPPYEMDRTMMEACLGNLVTNAMDACTWDPDTEKRHWVKMGAAVGPDGGVILSVADNGKGIAEEDQAKILRASFTTKGIRGTGLGLLLTQKAVQEHGGTVAFSSTPGAGTTFRLTLPSSGGQTEGL